MDVHFSDIKWDATAVRIPQDGKVYRMRNLATIQESFDASQKQYVLVDSRNKRRICLISVETSEDYLFRQFQNRLFSSKISGDN